METKKVVLIVVASVAATLAVVFLIPRLFAPQTSTRQVPAGAGLDQPAPVVDYGPQIEEVRRVLAANPNDVGLLVELGNLNFDSFKSRGETRYAREAISAYERALALRPGDPNVITDLGTMYRDYGQPDKAVAAYRKAMAIDPAHRNSRLNLGVTLYYDLKDQKGAREAFEAFLKVEPSGPQADSIRTLLAGMGQ